MKVGLNIRGSLKNEAKNFLTNNIKQNKIFFNLDSNEGWFHDSGNMSKEINSKYVLIGLKSCHLQNNEFFNNVINELNKVDAEYLILFKFFFGDQLESFKKLQNLKNNNLIYCFYG